MRAMGARGVGVGHFPCGPRGSTVSGRQSYRMKNRALAAGALRHEPRVVWVGAPPAWVVGIARSMLPRYWR
jgi:hypothetical protein